MLPGAADAPLSTYLREASVPFLETCGLLVLQSSPPQLSLGHASGRRTLGAGPHLASVPRDRKTARLVEPSRRGCFRGRHMIATNGRWPAAPRPAVTSRATSVAVSKPSPNRQPRDICATAS